MVIWLKYIIIKLNKVKNEVYLDVQMCIKHEMLHSYVSYYTFTLKQAIQKKKSNKYMFSEGDLMYILKSLVGFAC